MMPDAHAFAREWIAAGDEVHYVTTDPITESLILGLKPTAQSLARFYEVGRERQCARRAGGCGDPHPAGLRWRRAR